MSYLLQAKEAVRRLHRCEAFHVETVHVRESRGGKVVWDSPVEVFALDGCRESDCCFVWSYVNQQAEGKLEFISVPAVDPITTPTKAVLSVLEWEARGKP